MYSFAKSFAVAASSAIAVIGSAVAAPVSVTDIDAAWSNVLPAGQTNVTITNDADGDNAFMRWFDSNDDASSYNFATATTPINDNVPPTTPAFSLGTFTHDNQSIIAGTTAWTNVTLSLVVDLVLDGQAFNNVALSFNFNHNETENNPASGVCVVGVVPCPDIITVTNNSLNQSWIVNGVKYTLEILGLSTDNGSTFTNQFVTLENNTNNAELFARISAMDVPDVPLPGAVWLMIAGLGGLGFASRSKKKA